jgi:hypothetical protein
MSRILWDEAQWPLVRVTWEGVITSGVLDAYFAHLDQALARQERIGVVTDVRPSEAPGPAERKRIAAELLERDGALRAFVVMAVVLPNQFHRGVLTAINWLAPPPYPQRAFVELDDGVAWVTRMLDAPASQRATG